MPVEEKKKSKITKKGGRGLETRNDPSRVVNKKVHISLVYVKPKIYLIYINIYFNSEFLSIAHK